MDGVFVLSFCFLLLLLPFHKRGEFYFVTLAMCGGWCIGPELEYFPCHQAAYAHEDVITNETRTGNMTHSSRCNAYIIQKTTMDTNFLFSFSLP